MERKDQPKGICDPPTHSIWRLCTRKSTDSRTLRGGCRCLLPCWWCRCCGGVQHPAPSPPSTQFTPPPQTPCRPDERRRPPLLLLLLRRLVVAAVGPLHKGRGPQHLPHLLPVPRAVKGAAHEEGAGDGDGRLAAGPPPAAAAGAPAGCWRVRIPGRRRPGCWRPAPRGQGSTSSSAPAAAPNAAAHRHSHHRCVRPGRWAGGERLGAAAGGERGGACRSAHRAAACRRPAKEPRAEREEGERWRWRGEGGAAHFARRRRPCTRAGCRRRWGCRGVGCRGGLALPSLPACPGERAPDAHADDMRPPCSRHAPPPPTCSHPPPPRSTAPPASSLPPMQQHCPTAPHTVPQPCPERASVPRPAMPPPPACPTPPPHPPHLPQVQNSAKILVSRNSQLCDSVFGASDAGRTRTCAGSPMRSQLP